MTEPSISVSLELEPEVIEELRRKEERQRHDQEYRTSHRSQENSDGNSMASNNDSQGDQNHGAEQQEDWSAVLMLPPNLKETNRDEEKHLESECASEERHQTVEEEDDDDVLSLTPPPHLPILLINLQVLLGYTPSTAEDAKVLQGQVRQAMWGANYSLCESTASVPDHDSPSDDNNKIQVSQEFESRVADLFETGAARHGDSGSRDLPVSNGEGNHSWMILEYPKYFCRLPPPGHDPKAPNKVQIVKTERMWKRLLVRQNMEVVDRLLDHLRNCSRCLSWKLDLYNEILELAQREYASMMNRRRRKELREWRMGRRKEQLDRLYEVRETLEDRTNLARLQFQSLDEARSMLVAKKLRELRIQSGKDVGLEALDFDSTLSFQFPTGTFLMSGKREAEDLDDGGLILHDDEDDYQTPLFDEEEDAFPEEEEGGCDDDTDNVKKIETPVTEDIDVMGHESTSHDNEATPATLDKESLGTVRRQRKALSRPSKDNGEEAEHSRKLEMAQEDEKRMKEACTTEELKVAEALMLSLEERLGHVDELLENMQEEEWADEEDGIGDMCKEDDDDDCFVSGETASGVSLLDQILAMILSAVPLPSGSQENHGHQKQKHLQYLLREHMAIVKGWNDYFGRLPPPIEIKSGTGLLQQGLRSDYSSSQTHSAITSGVPENIASRVPTQQEKAKPKKSVSEMRLEYGIDNMETSNWEDDEDDDINDDDEHPKGLTSLSPLRPKTKMVTLSQTGGLRPGGRV